MANNSSFVGNRFFSLWLCLFIIVVFVFQSLFVGFTSFFVLDQNVFFGELWRLVSSIFLHGGLRHLIFNLFGLALFGFSLEQTIGSRRFLWVFFVTGVLANVISVNFYSSSLGASGALMGIIGTLTFLRPRMMVWAFGVTMPLFLAAVVWIISDVIGVFVPDGVGNIAHLSGIGFGFLCGWYYRSKISNLRQSRVVDDTVHVPDHVVRNWEMTYLVKR